MPDRLYRRRSARVLLLDGADRVLLFHSRPPRTMPELSEAWSTPGGGVEDGEPLATAAARELWEETGLRVAPQALGAPVALTSGYADLGWMEGVFRDDFFLLRTAAHEVETSGQDRIERESIIGHRWWTVPELAGTTERVVPLGLASLVEDLLSGGIPTEPIIVPWHH